MGGGFGPKAAVYVEYLVAAAAAVLLNRPVKWTETRTENMVSMVARPQLHHGHAKMGINRDGKIVGLKAKVIADGRRLPGHRRHAADAHPDDVARPSTTSPQIKFTPRR